MQKLEERNTYTPTSAVPACGSVAEGLNSSERVGAVSFSLKTSSNNSEEHLHSSKSEQDLRVPVLNMRGEPMMPTTPRKARKLLEQGKAKVVSRTPFVIQLLYPTGEAKQDVTLGIDAGYKTIGYSAITAEKELIAGELELRTDIKRLLEKRRAYRRTRRNRLWHREPRFDNRGRNGGWFAPSIQHKLDSHVKLINWLKKILPITRIIVEVASFDTQKMQNPEIKGIEYQHGELRGYEIKEYLLEKWKRKCAYCGRTDIPLEVEHIIPKSRGGSDRVSNLTISCHECNQKKGNQTAEEFGYPRIQKKAEKTLKATVFMNVIRWRLVNTLNCDWTYGHITKHNRIKLGLEKSHVNDAFVIACGLGQIRSEHIIVSKQVRRQNRSRYKANFLKGGRLKRNTVKEVNGFRRFDMVLYSKTKCFIHGLRSSGYFDIRTVNGEKIDASVNCKKLMLIEHAKGIIQEVRTISPTTEVRGFPYGGIS
jgi:5-methylcytosine-specific restriction endonuclease McrA